MYIPPKKMMHRTKYDSKRTGEGDENTGALD
jgi:hypothetical protein